MANATGSGNLSCQCQYFPLVERISSPPLPQKWGASTVLPVRTGSFVFWLFLLLPLLALWPTTGEAQTDGRFQISLDTNRLPLSSSGEVLTTNLSLQLGTFTNSTNALEVLALIRGQTNQSGIVALLTNNFRPLFSTNRVTNVLIPTNILTLPTNIPIGGVSRSNDIPAYILIFNHTNPASATEMGIFRARSASTNALTNAFFPSNSVRGRIFLSGGDGTSETNTALKLGLGVLFGQATDGRLRLAPIGPPEQMIETSLTAFVGLDTRLSLRAHYILRGRFERGHDFLSFHHWPDQQ